MFQLSYMPAAERYFKKLKDKKLKNAYREALTRISDDPYSGEMKTGDLAGIYCLDVYYGRTAYEIAYRIYEDSGSIVVVIMAGTRENFYQELKRYIK